MSQIPLIEKSRRSSTRGYKNIFSKEGNNAGGLPTSVTALTKVTEEAGNRVYVGALPAPQQV